MKKTNLTEYRNMAVEAIDTKIKDLKAEIATKRLEKAMDKLKDHKVIWKLRKEVAVLSTILGQKITIAKIETVEKGVSK